MIILFNYVVLIYYAQFFNVSLMNVRSSLVSLVGSFGVSILASNAVLWVYFGHSRRLYRELRLMVLSFYWGSIVSCLIEGLFNIGQCHFVVLYFILESHPWNWFRISHLWNWSRGWEQMMFGWCRLQECFLLFFYYRSS